MGKIIASPCNVHAHNITYSQFFASIFLCVNFLKIEKFSYQNILPLFLTHNSNIPINDKMTYYIHLRKRLQTFCL